MTPPKGKSKKVPYAHDSKAPERSTGANTGPEGAATHPLLKSLAQEPEPDGATLHCISINELVMKMGRITVPPTLGLPLEGYCSPAPTGQAYGTDNLPPHMAQVHALKDKGIAAVRNFLRGGWKEAQDGERWWEQAFAGEVEEMRKERLASVAGIRQGMEAARSFRPKV